MKKFKGDIEIEKIFGVEDLNQLCTKHPLLVQQFYNNGQEFYQIIGHATSKPQYFKNIQKIIPLSQIEFKIQEAFISDNNKEYMN